MLLRPARPLVALPLLLLGACGAAGPVDAFPDDGERIWEAYDQRGTSTVERTLDEDVTSFQLRLDCVSEDRAEIEVALRGVGAGGIPCGDGDGDGRITLGREDPVLLEAGTVLTIEVTPTPDDVRWSAAVDLG